MRVKNGVEPINHTADTARGGSRPKPPKAVAQRASLEAPGAVSEHQTAKRRLTAKTVALSYSIRQAINVNWCVTTRFQTLTSRRSGAAVAITTASVML